MRNPFLATLVLAAAVGSGACGQDEDAKTTSAARTPKDNIARYCALTRELDAAGTRFFARLERQNASPEDFRDAERRFVRQNAGRLGEIERVAPRAIAEDVRVILAAMRERGGLEPGMEVSQEQAQAAERRVKRLEQRQCRG